MASRLTSDLLFLLGSARLSIYQKSTTTTTIISSTSSKATTASASASASSSSAAFTLSNGWTSGACFSDSPRLVRSVSLLKPLRARADDLPSQMSVSYILSTMTYDICTNYCSSQGYTQAGESTCPSSNSRLVRKLTSFLFPSFQGLEYGTQW